MASPKPKSKESKVLQSRVPLSLMNAGFAAAQPLVQPMRAGDKDGERPTSGITLRAFEVRKRFACFTERDAELVSKLRPVFERHADEQVDRFYEHLQQYPALTSLLDDPRTVQRIKGLQREYLLSLAGGEYGEDYGRNRLKIGRVHDRIGLEPEWFLGAYGLYLDLLIPMIHEHFADDRERAVRASSALTKLMVLDMQLVLDAYYGLKQKRAVERSEQLAAVGELAASIAHEVRNPLAGMKGALEVLRKELAVKPSNLEVVDELLAQIVRLENLVRDLLNFARPRAAIRRGFDLHEMLDRLLRMYKEQSDASGITVQRTYEPGTGHLTADATQMEQVFLNLIHNAIQAMEGGGTLWVHARAVDRSVRVSFKDSGKGIPAGDIARIFQPFFTTKHRGSGLGLPTVLKIAEAHGGTVDIKSDLGRGTTAIVTIPT